MTPVEIILIIIGLVFFVGSFFITEKLTGKDMEKISELSKTELNTVMEKELAEAKARITEIVDDNVDLSINKLKREIDKKTSDTLMAIGEYSESVNVELQKANKEATFLYSMLCDKHDEINELNDSVNETITEYKGVVKNKPTETKKEDSESQVKTSVTEDGSNLSLSNNSATNMTSSSISDLSAVADGGNEMARLLAGSESQIAETEEKNNNQDILRRYNEGQSIIDIARELKMGQGEVSLIVRLYNNEGDTKDEA